MPESSPTDVHESPDERMQRRRTRRWKRRARIIGPFLGVPLLLGTLALSVDLIEYQPQKPAKRLSDRPIPKTVVDQQQQKRAISMATSVSTASVVTANPILTDSPGAALDLSLSPGDETKEEATQREFAPPQPPYAMRGQR